MNTKKILIGCLSVLVVAGGVVAMSAYEAHIVNVTAHIENALNVHPNDLSFGTVFPQEYLVKGLAVRLSDSFLNQRRVKDVEYVIKQKPKCVNANGLYAPVDYATHQCPVGYTEMLSLCPYLSKMDGDPNDGNDTGHPSYYVGGNTPYCQTVTADATGVLDQSTGDLLDLWNIDLKVPPISGTVGQEWPAGCPVLASDSKDYGCDLWIEVTGFSYYPL